MNQRTIIHAFFDPSTWTVSYVVSDGATGAAAVIDPVLDYDFKSGHTGTKSADQVLAYLAEQQLKVEWILETHAHADHLSGARYLQERVGGRIAVGEKIREVQATFKKLYNLEREFLPDGSHFDHLFRDGETFMVGDVQATALLVPGHTPADMAYLVDGAVFVGDTLFMPDVGTARADFPGGDARTLYRSMRRLLELPADTRMYVCHDYPPKGREAACSNNRRRAAREEHSRARRHHGRWVRGHAPGARCDARGADAHPAFSAGERARRPVAAGRRQRGGLSAHSAERTAKAK